MIADIPGVGNANGIASLDSSGRIPESQISKNVPRSTVAISAITLDMNSNGKIIETTSSSTVTFNLPNNLPGGFNIIAVQKGAGQIVFNPVSGAVLRHPEGHTRTAKQYASCTLYVSTNGTGTNAEYILSGNTAA